MKTKKELEQAIIMLGERVVSNTSEMMTVQADLQAAEKELADMNKPELTPLQFDNLYEAVERAVGEYDFSNEDNYDTEFGINYDGKVHLENFDISDTRELIEGIVEELTKLFAEAECTDA